MLAPPLRKQRHRSQLHNQQLLLTRSKESHTPLCCSVQIKVFLLLHIIILIRCNGQYCIVYVMVCTAPPLNYIHSSSSKWYTMRTLPCTPSIKFANQHLNTHFILSLHGPIFSHSNSDGLNINVSGMIATFM